MKALILAAVLIAPAPALAQSWESYEYPDHGFAVAFPAPPTVTEGTYKAASGAVLPSTTYALRQPDIALSIIVVDYAKAPAGQEQTAIADAAKVLAATGEVKIDVEARIDRQYGRSLSVLGKDGGRTLISVFLVDHKLYELEARALPPRPDVGSAKTLRFQQSLDFLDAVAVANRPENRAENSGPGFGPGGPGGRPPPAGAFADCRGKSVGEAVRHTIPAGQVVAATCVQTPQGLAARPNVPPPGGPRGGGPRGGGPPPQG